MQLWFCTYLNGRLLGAPRQYVLHGLNLGLNGGSCCPVSLALFLFVLSRPVSCCSLQRLKFHAHPSILAGQFTTDVQVNNTAVPHLIHIYTHIYIKFILLSVFFFTLLPPPLAGRLAQTLPVWHNNYFTELHLDSWEGERTIREVDLWKCAAFSYTDFRIFVRRNIVFHEYFPLCVNMYFIIWS
jgi:hypothetical protein